MFLSCHVRAFQSESTLYSLPEFQETPFVNPIAAVSDCNRTRAHNHLVRKGARNYLASLEKLSVRL